MTHSRSERGRGGVTAIAYLGLCLLAGVIGWAGVMAVVPALEAGSPAAPAIAAAATSVPTPSPIPTPTPTPTPTATPEPTPVPSPTKGPFLMDIYRPGTFVSQANRDYCMAGAIQNMVNIMGPGIDLTTARQQQIAGLVVSLTTRDDSHNGGFGPGGWALAMPQLGVGEYKLVIDPTFDQAMKDAALALARTSRPVGLLTWWGAHSWVMTGFRADADPLLFPNSFVLKGAFIVDPFYPRVSSIWGQTLGPDSFRDMTAMARNYIGWKRPEGRYPDRDGKWLLVVPVNS